MMKMKRNSGFTLIELLIVVAIIAILAAIAIPNFLAAQIRAKVSRMKGDFNSLGTAIEAYYVDFNSYPCYNNPYGQNGVFGDDAFGSYAINVLTSPIAYITSFPKDPFNQVSYSAAGRGYFLYTFLRYLNVGEGTYNYAVNGGGPFAKFYQANFYALRSMGPDNQWNSYIDPNNTGYGSQLPWINDPAQHCINGDVTLLCYDPSNGTVSRGDIYRTSQHGQY